MHIAVCDDNFADRKQTERLLAKESDRQRANGWNYYVDSFGNADALMSAPMKYDFFLIDITESTPNGLEVAVMLRSVGVTAPIALCCSKICYRELSPLPNGILFIDKPIDAKELLHLLLNAKEVKERTDNTFEIRGEQFTHYVYEEDLLYAIPEGHKVLVYLKDGTVIAQLGSMQHLIPALTNSTSLMIVNKDTLINITHIERLDGRYVIMDDQKKIPLRMGDKGRIRQVFNSPS